MCGVQFHVPIRECHQQPFVLFMEKMLCNVAVLFCFWIVQEEVVVVVVVLVEEDVGGTVDDDGGVTDGGGGGVTLLLLLLVGVDDNAPVAADKVANMDGLMAILLVQSFVL